MEKIEQSKIIQIASDRQNQIAGQFLKYYQQHPLEYPNKQELDSFKLTEALFGILVGRIASVPGGAVNPRFRDILEHQTARLARLGVTTDQLGIISAIHTSKSDLPETQIPVEYGWETIRGRFHAGSEYEMRHIHAHTSCGLSGGNSSTIRELQIAMIEDLQASRINLNVTRVDAIVGKHKEGRYCCTFKAALPEINDNQQIKFEEDGVELDPSEFNEQRRLKAEKGIVEIGMTCLDLRAGFTLHHPNVQKIDHGFLSEQVRNESWFARTFNETGPHSSLECLGHTEFPIGVFLHDEVGEETLSLAYYLLTHDQALLIHDQQAPNRFGRLAHSRVPIISVPSSFIDSEGFNLLRQQLFQLGSNLLSEVYDNGRIFGKFKFGRSTRGFIQLEDGIRELNYEDGLKFLMPHDLLSPRLETLTIAHPILGKFRNSLHPNPTIRAVYPWSKQSLTT